MKIRFGHPSDKKDYLKTQKEAFSNFDPRIEPKFFDQKVEKKEIFVLEEKGEYAGHICFGNYSFSPPFTGSVFVEELAVRKKFRGNGFGTALIKRVVRYCKKNNIEMIHISTGDFENNKAVEYYKKQGFEKVGFLNDLEPNRYDYNQIFYAVKIKNWKTVKTYKRY